MPALSATRWAALRARWELGAESTRRLAAEFGVSERAVRKRALHPRDPLRRDPEAARRARAVARAAALHALARARSAAEVRIDLAALAAHRPDAEAELAGAIAAANLRHLRMAAELRARFEAVCGLLDAVLTGDAASAAAARARLAGRGGLAGAVLLPVRLVLAIQAIERTALGVDGDPVRGAGAAAGAGRGGDSATASSFDAAVLTTEQLAASAAVAVLADRTQRDGGGGDGGAGRPAGMRPGGDGLPLPPTGPG